MWIVHIQFVKADEITPPWAIFKRNTLQYLSGLGDYSINILPAGIQVSVCIRLYTVKEKGEAGQNH